MRNPEMKRKRWNLHQNGVVSVLSFISSYLIDNAITTVKDIVRGAARNECALLPGLLPAPIYCFTGEVSLRVIQSQKKYYLEFKKHYLDFAHE